METYTATDIIKYLKKNRLDLFTLDSFGNLFNIKNQDTIYKKIQRLEKKGIVKKLIKGKYSFLLNTANDFKLANFLYQPSYISLESALSFYGIITGFPYKIISLTVKKTRTFEIDNKEFSYCHINENLFWGYEKKDDFLIAEKEKALLDLIYFYTKGLRSLDIEEIDTTGINKKILLNYGKRFQNKKLLAVIKEKIL